ncbi:hypothetical protein ACKWTF_006898 [Chironomus riparius]
MVQGQICMQDKCAISSVDTGQGSNDDFKHLIQIYTEWANYYLERHKSKRKVVDLSADARDGLLLAEIIEAVTSFKVPDLIKKPKNQQQMFDNVEACLIILRQNCVPGVEIITTNDIISGRLKAILSLFFSLSRFKQASKLKAPVRPLHSHDMMLTKERQLPVYTKTANGATAIPLPATVLVTRRCPPDKIRPLPPTPNHQSSIPSNKIASGSPSNESSRPNSPPDNNTPTKNGLRGSSKIPNPPYTSPQNGSNGSLLTNANLQQQEQQQAQQTPTKHSMLGKLKIFGKDKSTESPKTQLSKRTSSSSGFSSARSERSDSSLSLNNESTNIPTSQSSSSNKSTSTKKSDTGKVSNKAKVPAPATTINNNNITTAGKSSKGDKKDKSQLNNQAKESNGINAGANTDISPTKVHKIPQAKLQVPVGRKSESKTGLSSQQQQAKASTQSTSVSTSIPKPMAAIKGTSKTLQQQQMECNDKNQNNEHFDVIKVEKVSISVQNNNEIVQKTQIVNPLGMSPLHNHQLLNQTNNNNINGNNNNINGMQSATLLMSDSLRLTSTNNQSNSSDSSVIYRTASAAISTGGQASETNIHADIYQMQSHTNPISNRKLENFNDPLLINGNKFGMIPAKVNGVAQTIFEDDKETTSTMVPMRSLMRGFNNHMSSPSRMNRTMNGYYDENGQGYCSDGDAFRKSSIRYSDIENGYLSEGPHFLSILRNRPQMPSTIAEERCQSSREGNLDSADMESNSSKNSRDYWSNQQAASPTSSRKDKTSSPSHSRRSTPSAKSSSRTKGVPQNFGYIKRTNGSSTASEIQTNAMLTGGRTAHVSAVPRSNKLKVSGGTQTSTADFQQKLQNPQYRSFSLTGPGAAQLSQSVKERFGSHSLPKGGLDMHVFQQRMANRGSAKLNDGSLSDTQTYAEVKPEYNTYAMWLKHNSGTTANRLSEGDSLEAVSIVSSPGLSRNSKLLQQSRDSTPQSSAQQTGQNSKLNRSNSISYLQERTYPRSTKSEKMYPSMLSRGPDIESEPYYCLPVNAQGMVPWSQPTSPQPTPSRGFTGLLSPTHNTSHRLTYPKKNDEVHGSQISLMSGGSSMYGSTTEEQRQANEVRRLKRELTEAREQVMSLSSQLSTNAHVVNAFEQSLQNMTNRLQQLTATTEKKESEITEMRQTIELLRKQSIQAGLTQAHMQSMGVQVNVNGSSAKIINGSPTKINGQQEQHLHHQHHQHHQLQPQQQQQNGNMQRQHSTDSMCSVNSNGSNGSSSQEKKKKKGWLRSSFTKAFSRNAKITKTNRQTNHSDSKSSLPPTPQKNSSTTIHDSHGATGKLSPTKSPHRYIPVVENAKPVDSIENDNHPVIEDLKKQLREKDMVLTDIRLEALTQASQMENLKDTVQKMRQEMMNLKQNNERLQRMVSTRSLAGSEASLHGCPASPSGSLGDSRRYSLATDNGMSRPPLELPQNLDENEEEPPAPAPDPPPAPLSPTIITDLSPTIERISISNEILSTPAEDVADPVDGKRIGIAVFLGQPEAFVKYSDDMNEQDQSYDFKTRENGFDLLHSQETIIACTYISGKTTWQNLDYIVRKTFKDYLSRIDPSTNLGLNTDSITSYHLGEAKRGPEMGFPELLPCGYIIGHVKTLYICLQGVGSLAFDSLIPRSIVHRYINLLTEHRRLILCGPKGTGKSYLARKLAEFLVAKSNRSPAESIATFNVDNKSSNLQQYLGTIAEQATINGAAEELPLVIILDNLHHASALGDVFSCLLSAGPAAKLPCIIGTMSQATCNTTNLQLHHNFRWVLTANHMEPVKGFLGRYLRRRLFHHDLLTGSQQTQMEKVFKWLPGVWLHVNTFLENHSSSDVTIGPQLFLQCPLSEEDSQKWFVDLWNHQLAPYLVDAIKEGVQLYGRRGNSWTDPCLYVRETYPWKITPTTVPTLRQITADDVGLEAGVTGNMDSDPLLNMLHMLQQAAASENVDHDNSDCASLDSNFTHESAGTEQ